MRRFQPAPLSPQRLEKRRVLDASAAELLFGPLAGTGEYVQAGENFESTDGQSDEGEQQGPSNVALFLGESELFEADELQLGVMFENPGNEGPHTVTIDWGDGSTVETHVLDPGTRYLGTCHTYLDDGPTSAPIDMNTIEVRVFDASGDSAMATAAVTIKNVAPTIDTLSISSPIKEGQVATLTGTFTDPGTQDTYSLDIDWDGDGEFDETVEVSGGKFEASRLFPDDNPTSTLADTFDVTVRLRDDDMGSDTKSVPLTVEDLSPVNVVIEPIEAIDENGFAQIRVTFEDDGLEDTHFASINWGDGSPLERVDIAPGERSVIATHQYLDDDPTGTPSDSYTIRVGIINDDLGRSVPRPTAQVVVNNVKPVLTVAADQEIGEGELLDLTGGGLGAFTDVGTRDTHAATVDWGDGTSVEAALVTPNGDGSGTLSGSHTYAENGVYTVTVTVLDDDLGVTVETFQVTVANEGLELIVAENQMVDEGALLDLTDGALGSFTYSPADDTHIATVDWGDGSPVEPATVDQSAGKGTLSGSHTYADDGVYTVTVTVLDEELGETVETFEVLVKNVDPVLVVPDDQRIDEGAQLDLSSGGLGSFTDAGVVDTHTATVDWGDGSPLELVTVNQSNGSGTLDASHIYADNGVYTVTVMVLDDDLGETIETFLVRVDNVDPELAGIDPIPQVNEGQTFTLSELGVTLQDPGFDNPLNPNYDFGEGETEEGEVLGSVETFTAATINWGDGTTVEALGVVNRVSGGPGIATIADLESFAHTFADNGLYTVTVTIGDDDGGLVERTFQIQVNNVAPSLELTERELLISESETLNLFDLGEFSDPGFNNPLNVGDDSNGGEVVETFSYTIDWGDGTVETGQLPANVLSGSVGVKTLGELVDSHQYLDNDADNLYTITVTLSDDDGGTVTRTITAKVLNVDPTLIPIISATDVTTRGETTIVIEFEDPGTETLTVWVDWGDKLALPPGQRFVPETAVAGPGTNTLTLQHKYDGPPDPTSPASDILISVFVRDDDFGFPLVVGPGQSETQAIAISNPGVGNQPIVIDTTPEVPRLLFPDQDDAVMFVGATASDQGNVQTIDLRTAVGDTKSTTDRYLELRVIDPATDAESEGYRLRTEVLDDLPGLFRTLPDNRYRIYLVRTETNTRRLVIEVYVRNGKLIDPGDDSEGTRDRPPTDETGQVEADERTIEEPILQPAQSDAELENEAKPGREEESSESDADDTQPNGEVRRRMLLGTSLVGLAASQAGRSWSERIEKALANADSQKWQKLRRRVNKRDNSDNQKNK